MVCKNAFQKFTYMRFIFVQSVCQVLATAFILILVTTDCGFNNEYFVSFLIIFILILLTTDCGFKQLQSQTILKHSVTRLVRATTYVHYINSCMHHCSGTIVHSKLLVNHV